jgi:hypothetical protein
METRTADPIFDRANDPTLIPAIYNYCDRCCHRCPFTARCLTYRDSEADLRHVADDPTASVAAVVEQSLSRSLEVMRQVAERLGIEIDVTPDDEAAVQERYERDLNDPLVKRSREYAGAAYGIVRALMPILADRDDDDLTAAATRIEETCCTISSKIFRAVGGVDDDWNDRSDVQSEANGSAKVARLLIGDARRAWKVLMEAGRAAADGVPARFVATLDELDRDVDSRFPRAMDFVRPGFDDPQSHVLKHEEREG